MKSLIEHVLRLTLKLLISVLFYITQGTNSGIRIHCLSSDLKREKKKVFNTSRSLSESICRGLQYSSKGILFKITKIRIDSATCCKWQTYKEYLKHMHKVLERWVMHRPLNFLSSPLSFSFSLIKVKLAPCGLTSTAIKTLFLSTSGSTLGPPVLCADVFLFFKWISPPRRQMRVVTLNHGVHWPVIFSTDFRYENYYTEWPSRYPGKLYGDHPWFRLVRWVCMWPIEFGTYWGTV